MAWFRKKKGFKDVLAKVLQDKTVLEYIAKSMVKEGYVLKEGIIIKKEEKKSMMKQGTFGSPPMLDRSKSVGSAISPYLIAEEIMRDVRRVKGGLDPKEKFKTVVAENKDLNTKQIEAIKAELQRYGVIIED